MLVVPGRTELLSFVLCCVGLCAGFWLWASGLMLPEQYPPFPTERMVWCVALTVLQFLFVYYLAGIERNIRFNRVRRRRKLFSQKKECTVIA